MDKAKKETLESFMKAEEIEALMEDDKSDKITLDEPKRRTWLVVLLTVFVTLLIAGGVYAGWQAFRAQKELTSEEKIETTIKSETNTDVTNQNDSSQSVYINAPEGLNLRKEASSSGEVLAIIPMGTKLTVLETNGDWYKVQFESNNGWIAKLYTSTTDPLVYKNTAYGFQVTFPVEWGTYKLFPIKADGTNTAAYYVGLATGVAGYNETGVDTGYASMFALSVFTPPQWENIQAEEGPKPSLVTRNDKYVLGYTLPNGIPPEDLKSQRDTANSVINTIKFY